MPPGTSSLGSQRGSACLTRAAGDGAFGGQAHTSASNEGIVVVVVMATPERVANAASIAAVDGVDAVFIGPDEMVHAMGCENRWNEQSVHAAIEHTVKAVAAAGNCPAILALTPEGEDRHAARGARYFANASTGIIAKAHGGWAQSR